MFLEKPRKSAYASRPEYDSILEEFDSCDSVDAIDILINEKRSIIETFPESWEHFILAEYDYRRKQLDNQQEENSHAFT